MYVSLKYYGMFTLSDTEPSVYRLLIDASPIPYAVRDQSVNQTNPLTAGVVS
jgi:hypothetical protein